MMKCLICLKKSMELWKAKILYEKKQLARI